MDLRWLPVGLTALWLAGLGLWSGDLVPIGPGELDLRPSPLVWMTFDNARLTPDMVGLKPVRLFWGCVMVSLGLKSGCYLHRIYLGAGLVLLAAFELRKASERVSASAR